MYSAFFIFKVHFYTERVANGWHTIYPDMPSSLKILIFQLSYFSFQISLLYSIMVLSEEKNPAFAIFSIIFFHFSLSS